MFDLAPSAINEGAEGSQKGSQPSAGARRRGAERSNLLVVYKIKKSDNKFGSHYPIQYQITSALSK